MRQIVIPLLVRVAVVLSVLGMKALAQRITRSRSTKGALGGAKVHKDAAASKHSSKPLVTICWNPGCDYKPSNPRWLEAATNWTPDSIPSELLQECPALTAFKEAAAAGQLSDVAFGSLECKQQLFQLDESFTYLNHGSYGAAFRVSLDVQQWYRQQMELEPVKFMETTGVAGLVKSVAEVAAFVGADWRDVVPVVNATMAVNAVVHSIKLQKGDLLLMANTTYPAVRSTLAARAAAAGAGLLELNLELTHLQDADLLLSAYRAALSAGGRRLKLVVVDHVVSFPPVIMPVKQICQMCRDAGVPVLVDGAHAVGALTDLDIPSLGCLYYTTNLHKWMCTPKGAALLWVHPSQQAVVRPLVVSHGYGLGFRAEFLWQGTSDLTPWLSTSACVAVMQALQPHRVAAYNHGLVRQATTLLLQAWGTQLALGISKDGSTAGMVAVQLPWPLRLHAIGSGDSSGSCASGAKRAGVPQPLVQVNAGIGWQQPQQQERGGPTLGDAAALNRLLREEYRIEVPVACVEGALWCRISAQIYNRLDDYQRLADVVQTLVSD